MRRPVADPAHLAALLHEGDHLCLSSEVEARVTLGGGRQPDRASRRPSIAPAGPHPTMQQVVRSTRPRSGLSMAVAWRSRHAPRSSGVTSALHHAGADRPVRRPPSRPAQYGWPVAPLRVAVQSGGSARRQSAIIDVLGVVSTWRCGRARASSGPSAVCPSHLHASARNPDMRRRAHRSAPIALGPWPSEWNRAWSPSMARAAVGRPFTPAGGALRLTTYLMHLILDSWLPRPRSSWSTT